MSDDHEAEARFGMDEEGIRPAIAPPIPFLCSEPPPFLVPQPGKPWAKGRSHGSGPCGIERHPAMQRGQQSQHGIRGSGVQPIAARIGHG